MVKRLLLLIILCTVFLVGCQSEPAVQESSTALNPDSQTQPAEERAPTQHSAADNPEENPQDITIPISPPADWFFTHNTIDDLSAVVFTNYNPEQLWADAALAGIPGNFAAGALVISPFPADSDPESLQAGLQANLDKYGAQDMEGMLYISDQIGLIDLTKVEGVEFISAGIGTLAGQQALLMEGIITLEGADQLHAQIWLTWTQSYFVSLYEFAAVEIWPSAEPIFSQTRETIVLP